MNYKDLNLKKSYKSCGDDNIINSFLIPCLRITKIYKRSVAYFSSSVLNLIVDGIVEMAENGGHIQLICSPELSTEDIEAINTGYKKRDLVIKDSFRNKFSDELEKINLEKLELLSLLIENYTLDIKIVVTTTLGIYHDKLGILEDMEGNKIAFFGSSNSSLAGYQINYEKIRLVFSWIESDRNVVDEELEEFDSIWNGTNSMVEVYEFRDYAKNEVNRVIKQKKAKKNPVVLRDYQEEAIKMWKQNNFNGFYIMATGTGKTWTAIYSGIELLKVCHCTIVICAPYKHLIKQWRDDVEKVFSEAEIIMVSSENIGWEEKISEAAIKKRYNLDLQIIIISTIISFGFDKFEQCINKINGEKLLIVDEAHRFTKRNDDIRKEYKYKLGLSATPFSGLSSIKGRELMDFFGGKVFELPIEAALSRGFLVPYKYHPIYVYANDEEENRFKYYNRKIAQCFKNNVCINHDLLVKSIRARLRVISMAEEKILKLPQILESINVKDHFVVYCGDGKLFDDEGNEKRFLSKVKEILFKCGYKSSQFTAKENIKERMELIDAFGKGQISSLVAIRCLDEGINIPSIQSALILSSNDDYREFVQRRGRILRLYEGKKYADIFDIITLPSLDNEIWAKIELRRFLEYAKLAQNWKNELQSELNNLLKKYNISLENIDVYDYEVEEPLDE